MAVAAIGASLVVATATAPSGAQEPSWRLVGPDGGYISLMAGSTNYLLAVAYRGLYRSTDRGENWQRVPSVPPMQSIAVSPHNTNRIVASSQTTIWRSSDGGVTWTSADAGVGLYSLLFNPSAAHPDELLAIGSDTPNWFQEPRLMRSLDGGLSWLPLGEPAFKPYGVTIDPSRGTYFAVLADDRLIESWDRGASWGSTWMPPSIQMPNPSAMVVMDAEPTVLWTSNGNWVSDMMRYDGISIEPVWRGAASTEGLFRDPLQNGRAWVSIRTELSEFILVESEDAGISWNRVPSNRNARLLAVLSNGMLFGASSAGPMISTNSGRFWTVRSRGIPLAQINAVSSHSAAPASLIAFTRTGIVVSADAGATWQETSGIPLLEQASSSIGRHPDDPAVALASANNAVYRTTDGGLSWQTVPYGGRTLLDIIYDAADPRRVSARTSGSELIASEDGGATWQTIQSGIRRAVGATATRGSRLYGFQFREGSLHNLLRAERHGVAMTPLENAPTVYALAVQPHADHVLLALGEGSTDTMPVFLSTDSGDSWQMRGALPNPGVENEPILIFDACDPNTAYAFVRTVLYRTHDRGLTWQPESIAMPIADAVAHTRACANGQSHLTIGSLYSGGLQVRSPVQVESIATNDFEPM